MVDMNMRKLYNILYAALVALVLASCQNNDESLNAVNQRGTIEFTVGFNAMRSHFGDKSGSAYPSFWDGNEKLRLAIESSDYPTYRPSGTYAMEKVDAEGKSATFTATIDQYFSNGTVYAFVPATAWHYNPLGNGDFAGFEYTIPATQTPTAKSVDPAAHILMVQHPFSAGLQSAVSLNFDHIVAYGKLSIPALEGEDVTSVQIDILDASGEEYSYTLNVSGLEEPLYWFACEPCSASAISIVATTADKQFAYTREFDAEAAVAFNTGRVRPLTIAGELIDPSQPEPTYPNREIRYTAKAKVEANSNYPWSFDTFGAKVVSHEWNSESGKGVISFDADVTTIGERAFYECSSLTSITIPDSVTTIGKYAFYYCTSLTSVTIHDSVMTIGDSAFAYCSSLTSVTIPNSVTTIGDSTFNGCSSLTSVTIPDSVTTIGEFAFHCCDSLTSVSIPDSVTTIGEFAFHSCDSLTSVTIPDSVTTIGFSAFSFCSSLTSVTIPDSVTTIGEGAFDSCSSLISITIGDSVTTIGDYAFRGCSSLTSVTIPDSVTTIGGNAFSSCSKLTSITIPDSVTTIGDYAFNSCSSLTSVYCEATTPPSLGGSNVFDDNASGRKIYVPAQSVEAYKSAEYWSEYADAIVGYDFEKGEVVTLANREIRYTATAKVEAHSNYAFGANVVSNEWNSETGEGVISFDGDVTTIGDSAFYYCKSLTSVTIPDSVTTIGSKAFSFCSNLTSVTIPESVTSIGDYAFYNCDSLTSVTIGNSVTTIGNYAFDSCDSLTSVTIGNSVTTIGSRAFGYCTSLTSVTIPDSVTTIGEGAFTYCSSLTEFDGKFVSEDGRCLIIDGVLNSFAPAELTSYIISDSVTTIGDYAFLGCKSLTSVAIPNSVTTIGDLAFSGCNGLTSITIPFSVVAIGDEAFWNCYSLESVYCEATTPPVGGSKMFCNMLDQPLSCVIYVPAASVEAYKSAEYWSYYADAIIAYDFENGVVVEPEVSVNNEIRYTATAKVEANSDYPWSFDTFGANILSHDFNEESGKGIITFDAEVMTIGDYAFLGCSSLTSVTIPDSVTTIGDAAFYECSSLTSITIPDGVTTIGKWAFYSCDSLTSITIPDSVTTIRDYAFRECSSLTSVTIGNGVTTIGECAFYYCESLTSVTIGNSVTTIGEYAFYNCSSLTSVTIGDSVTTIGDYAFTECSSLTSITIPDSVTTIGKGAFSHCSSLTSVTIGNSVTTIGKGAFYECDSLASVYCEATTPPSLDGSYVFDDNASGRKIYVPAASVEAYKTAEYWSEYAYAIVGYDF